MSNEKPPSPPPQSLTCSAWATAKADTSRMHARTKGPPLSQGWAGGWLWPDCQLHRPIHIIQGRPPSARFDGKAVAIRAEQLPGELS